MKDHWRNAEWFRVIFQKLMNIHTDCSYGYLSIFPNLGNRAEVYNNRPKYQSLESLPNLAMNSYCVDGVNCNNSNSDTIEYLPSNFVTDISLNWPKYQSIPMDKNKLKGSLEIDNKTVKRALQIIKEKSNKETEEQRDDFKENRLEDIWNLLKELKNELALMKLDK